MQEVGSGEARSSARRVQGIPELRIEQVLPAVVHAWKSASFEMARVGFGVGSVKRKHAVMARLWLNVKSNYQTASGSGCASEGAFTTVEVVHYWRARMARAESRHIALPMLYLCLGFWEQLMLRSYSFHEGSDELV